MQHFFELIHLHDESTNLILQLHQMAMFDI